MPSRAPTPDQVGHQLQALRRGPGLTRPLAIRAIDPAVLGYLAATPSSVPTDGTDVRLALDRIGKAIDQLSLDERVYARVDLGLDTDHDLPTLTARQASLAEALGCTVKTVRRRSERAFESLAFIVATTTPQAQERSDPNGNATTLSAEPMAKPAGTRLSAFWNLRPSGRVDIVCSEIPPEERPDFASIDDRNYLRYAKFADLDSLIFIRTRLAQLEPTLTIRDFSPSEYFDTETDVLLVIGGPPWNAKYRQFLPQLPFHFQPNALGEDDPLVVPDLGLTLGPRWTAGNALVEDLAVFTRLSLAHGPRVFLFGGCLTLGVLGAASLFLRGEHGERNAAWLDGLVGDRDVVVVTEVRRVGGIADLSDLTTTEPLVVLARTDGRNFETIINHSQRYT